MRWENNAPTRKSWTSFAFIDSLLFLINEQQKFTFHSVMTQNGRLSSANKSKLRKHPVVSACGTESPICLWALSTTLIWSNLQTSTHTYKYFAYFLHQSRQVSWQLRTCEQARLSNNSECSKPQQGMSQMSIVSKSFCHWTNRFLNNWAISQDAVEQLYQNQRTFELSPVPILHQPQSIVWKHFSPI